MHSGATMDKNQIAGTKKEPNYRGIKAMPFVIGNETFEKLGTIGTSSNLLVYLTTVFNMKSVTATNVLNVFNGTCQVGALFGAFVSDTYLGRYKTIGIASISSFLGMLVLTLTAAIEKLHPPKCGSDVHTSCDGPSPRQLTFLFSGFMLLIIGASGIRPCNLAFGADQFNPNTDSGKRGINSFFNWYYFTYTFAMILSLTVIVYVQSNLSWAIGLGIPTFLMLLSCTFFFIGTRIYVKILPEGSPLTSIVQTLVVAFKKRKLGLSDQPLFNHIPADSINSRLGYTDQLMFLNKAAIQTPEDAINCDGSAADPWKLRSLQQVEEVKCIVKVIPIWVSAILYYIVLAITQSYVVFQAIQADRTLGRGSFKIPAASYNVYTMITLTIWIPIYDRILVPFLRKITGKEEGITILQRIGIGIMFGVLTMFISGFAENHRRNLAFTRSTLGSVPRKGAISSMSGNWLIPQLVMAGLSEGFAIIGCVEFFYKQFPENMRSLGPSFLLAGFAVSSYLSSFLISVVHQTTKISNGDNWLAEDLNRGRLDYFYYLVACLEIVNLGYFLICAKWYKYRKIDSTEKDESMFGFVSVRKIQSRYYSDAIHVFFIKISDLCEINFIDPREFGLPNILFDANWSCRGFDLPK
ncbi:protein nrt1/ ptr family 2.11 [Phtheirospermum japonicum]|uniref:Protein nrt1/ ptr family 2.11 n=1 Tax=Phtheirospermum japonicum TaxID=374723 RepID=A0A830DGL1_9LAMI|nr:protein nrt1/ ptr family 2.11 [Phtheirospermum japonicum]